MILYVCPVISLISGRKYTILIQETRTEFHETFWYEINLCSMFRNKFTYIILFLESC